MFPISFFIINYTGSDPLMIINKLNDIYIIKMPSKTINIYKVNELEDITKKIINKINKKYKIKNFAKLEIYTNKNYGSIIKIKEYNKISKTNDTEVKITVHIDTPFLYKIDYLNINTNLPHKEDIYYYKNNFYLNIKHNINKKEYLNILENSEILYENTLTIINNGIKL